MASSEVDIATVVVVRFVVRSDVGSREFRGSGIDGVEAANSCLLLSEALGLFGTWPGLAPL